MATPKDGSVIGKRLREIRKERGIAQDKLGVLIGLDETTASARISRYESGKHEPSFLVMKSIAKVLQVPVPFFYCEDDGLAELIKRTGNVEPDMLVQLTKTLLLLSGKT